MAEELITEYIDLDATGKQTEAFLSQLESLEKKLKELNSIKFTMDGLSKTKDLNTNSLLAAKGLEEITKASKEAVTSAKMLAQVEKDLAKAALDSAKAEDVKAKTTERSAKAREQSAKASFAEKKAIVDLTNDYMQLSKAYNETALRAKNYALQLGESHPVTVEAVKDAKAMYDTLYKIDQAVGQNQRNVGNYKSAFDGLGSSFTQVARELPSLTISAQQFFLAVSNNLPMVFDQISAAKNEIKALRAEGKEAPSLFSRITSSLFSTQVALSVGVTLLVAYGKEIANFVGKLFTSEKALDQAAQAQKIFNDTLSATGSEYKKAVSLVTDLKTNIDLAKQGFLDKDDVLKQYNSTIGKTTGEVKSLEQAEKDLQKNADAYVQMMLYKAAANAALEETAKKALAAEVNRQKKESEFQSISTNASVAVVGQSTAPAFVPGAADLDAQLKARQQAAAKTKAQTQKQLDDGTKSYEEIFKEFQKKAADIAKANKFNFFEDKSGGSETSAKFFSDELKDRAEALKEYSKIELFALKTRQDARQQAFAVEQQIVEAERSVSIANAKGDKNALEQIEQDSAFKQRKIREQLVEDLYAIGLSHRAKYLKQQETEKNDAEQHSKELAQIDKEAAEKRIKDAIEASSKIASELSQARDILLTDLNNRFAQGTIGEKEYNKRRLEIEQDYAKKALENEISLAQQLITIRRELGYDTQKEEEKLYQLRLKYSELTVQNERTKRQQRFAEIESDLKKLQGIYQDVYGVVSGLISAITDQQKNEIQEQIDAIEKRKSAEINAIEQSSLSEQDKAAKIAVLNAKAAAERLQLEQRQRQLDIQRAKFEKAANIGRIIIETALAVVHQLGSGDPYTAIPRAIAVGALGAAQLAVAIAQPIPKFRTGKDKNNNYEGPAIVGDGGKQELIYRKDGSIEVTPNVSTLTHVNKDDIILPDAMAVLQNASFRSIEQMTTGDPKMIEAISSLGKGLKAELQGLRSTIKNKPTLNLTVDERGMQAIHKYTADQIKYMNEQINW